MYTLEIKNALGNWDKLIEAPLTTGMHNLFL